LTKLVEHWALLDDERELVAGKRGPTRLGFALLLKFYARAGRFPRGQAELDDEAVAFVARQAGVPASDLGFYEWAGSTIEYHRAQVRRHLGFRECSAEDANKLTGCPTAGVCRAERRADRVREELFRLAEASSPDPMTPSAPWCTRLRGEKKLRDLSPRTSPPAPPTGAPCRPRCGPPTPGTTGAG
jgi:Domain of unknown function (DUF4158)